MAKIVHHFATHFLILLVLTGSFSLPVMAQSDMSYELSTENETYSILDTLAVNEVTYRLIVYQNGEVILLDNDGGLVLNTDLMKEVYGVKSFKDLFMQKGIIKAKYENAYSILDNLYANAKLVDNMMTWIAIAATLLGVSSILIGGAAIPVMVIVDAVKFATTYMTNNIQQPLNTAYELKSKMIELDSGRLSTSGYREVLSLSVDLRNQLNDLNNQLILTVVGYGSVVYYEALYMIADLVEVLSQDNANSLKKYASEIEESQEMLQAVLNWLKTLDIDTVTQSALSQIDGYVSLQNSRISSRKKDFQTTKEDVQETLSSAQKEISDYAAKGADVSIPNLLITEANSRIQTGETYLLRYEIRTGKQILMEASDLIEKARSAASVSLMIHQVEREINEAQDVINQKVANGANVSQATSELNLARSSLGNAKSLLANSSEEARRNADEAATYVEAARELAEQAVIPEQRGTQLIPTDSISTVLMVLAIAVVIFAVLYYIRGAREE